MAQLKGGPLVFSDHSYETAVEQPRYQAEVLLDSYRNLTYYATTLLVNYK